MATTKVTKDGVDYHVEYGFTYAEDSPNVWKEKLDKKSGKTFYVNLGTSEKKWSLPTGGGAASAAGKKKSSASLKKTTADDSATPLAAPMGGIGSLLSFQAATPLPEDATGGSDASPTLKPKKSLVKKSSGKKEEGGSKAKKKSISGAADGAEASPVSPVAGNGGEGGSDSDDAQPVRPSSITTSIGATEASPSPPGRPSLSFSLPTDPLEASLSSASKAPVAAKKSSKKLKSSTKKNKDDAEGAEVDGSPSAAATTKSSKKSLKGTKKKSSKAADNDAAAISDTSAASPNSNRDDERGSDDEEQRHGGSSDDDDSDDHSAHQAPLRTTTTAVYDDIPMMESINAASIAPDGTVAIMKRGERARQVSFIGESSAAPPVVPVAHVPSLSSSVVGVEGGGAAAGGGIMKSLWGGGEPHQDATIPKDEYVDDYDEMYAPIEPTPHSFTATEELPKTPLPAATAVPMMGSSMPQSWQAMRDSLASFSAGQDPPRATTPPCITAAVQISWASTVAYNHAACE